MKYENSINKEIEKGGKKLHTLALSWLMIFNLRVSTVPSFINDSNTSSGVIIEVKSYVIVQVEP